MAASATTNHVHVTVATEAASSEGEHKHAQLKSPHQVNMSVISPPSNTVHRRHLPEPPAVKFSSERGKEIFARALRAGTMNTYFPIAEQFTTQPETAFCGLSTLVIMLNSLSIDPNRVWKGPWRWFVEDMLFCCDPLESIKQKGIIFDRLACLARCNGAEVIAHHASSAPKNLLLFREHVERVCKGQEERLGVSYSRKAFQQTGDGHFSPIGGYDAEEDLVLLMDVARFKYPPHWVPLPLLWESMQAIDSESGKSRGWMVFSAVTQDQKLPPICYTVAGGHELEFAAMDRYMSQPVALPEGEGAGGGGVSGMVRAFFESLPESSCKIITLGEKAIESDETKEIRAELRKHRAFELIHREMSSYRLKWCKDICTWHPELATVLLLVTSASHIWDNWPSEDTSALIEFCGLERLPKVLKLEVMRIQMQLQRMQSECC